jgi:hypothetical protein
MSDDLGTERLGRLFVALQSQTGIPSRLGAPRLSHRVDDVEERVTGETALPSRDEVLDDIREGGLRLSGGSLQRVERREEPIGI